MNESSNWGGWIFAFLIVAVIFGWGGFGGGNNSATAAYATMADVNSAINNQSTQAALAAIQLSSANNNYETAQLINNQSMSMMNQNNTNLLAAINGFNAVTQNMTSGFNSVNQNIADLGYKMDQCCCSIKTLMLENRLQDTQAALLSSQTANLINGQSQYLLSQLGSYVPTGAAVI